MPFRWIILENKIQAKSFIQRQLIRGHSGVIFIDHTSQNLNKIEIKPIAIAEYELYFYMENKRFFSKIRSLRQTRKIQIFIRSHVEQI